MEKSSDSKMNSSLNDSNEQSTVEKSNKKRRRRNRKNNAPQLESDAERKTELLEVSDNKTDEVRINIATDIDLPGDDIRVETETSAAVVGKKGKRKPQKNKSNVGQGTGTEDQSDETKNNAKTIEKGAIKKIPSEMGSEKAEKQLENKSERNESFDYRKNNMPRQNQTNVVFKNRTIYNSSHHKDDKYEHKSSKKIVDDKQNRQGYQIDKQNQRDRNNPRAIKKEAGTFEVGPVKSNLSPEAQEFKSRPLNNKSTEGIKVSRSGNTNARIMKQETKGGISKQDSNRRSDQDCDSWYDSVPTDDSVNSSMENMSLKNKSEDAAREIDWDVDSKNKSEQSEVSQKRESGKGSNYEYNRDFRKDRDLRNDTDDRRRDGRGSDQYSKNRDSGSWSRGSDQNSKNRDSGSWSRGSDQNSKNRDSGSWNRGSDQYSKNRDSGPWRRSRDSDDTTFSKVKEVTGDLFEAPAEYSLAHCVAEDFRMGSGIAVQFRQQFGRVDELFSQRAKTGGLAYLEEGERFIYYLVTKKVSNGKPTLTTLESSLHKLKEQILENNDKKLAMPRIGCGLDRLEWREVKPMLNEIFADVDIEIVVYNFQQKEKDGTTPTRDGNKCFITHQQLPLVDIETGTGLLYIGYENGFVTPEIDSLDTKYKFIQDYKMCTVQTGDVFKIEKRGEYLYGLIIAKTEKDPFNFVALNKCLKTVRDMNKRDRYEYFGIQALTDPEDDLIMEKICTLIKNCFGKIEVWICWPEPLKHLMPFQH